ncbi:MAG: sulfatase [Cyclobacteriaceae bacterium]|nr:sulfatase [Cyclobacteriaceae bacterium]
MKKSLLLIPILFILFSACEQEKEQPNIVWMIAEDFSPDLACYGHPIVHSPNLDKLAAQGIRFNNAFASAPVCSSARSGFITGMYQTAIGADQHDTMEKNKLPLPQGVKTLPDYFHDAGYFVDFNGKTHFNFKYTGEGVKDRNITDREPGQPFFLVLQTHHTHRVFKRDTLRPIDPAIVEIPECYPDHEITRRDWANYLEDTQLLDRWVGQQMAWLEENQLLNNTIVVFFGDHGRPHVRGKQFLYDEGLRVPLIITRFGKNAKVQVVEELVSLIDLAPTMLQAAGLKVPDHMHGIDILKPVERDHVFASRSRNGDAIDKIRSLRTKDYLFIKNYMPHVPWMQLSSYKRTQYPVYTLLKVLDERNELTETAQYFMSPTKPVYELYYIPDDPHQVNNLAEKHPEKVQEFEAMLEKWRHNTHDYFEDPDLPDLVNMLASKRKAVDQWNQRAGLDINASDEEVLEAWRKILF